MICDISYIYHIPETWCTINHRWCTIDKKKKTLFMVHGFNWFWTQDSSWLLGCLPVVSSLKDHSNASNLDGNPPAPVAHASSGLSRVWHLNPEIWNAKNFDMIQFDPMTKIMFHMATSVIGPHLSPGRLEDMVFVQLLLHTHHPPSLWRHPEA